MSVLYKVSLDRVVHHTDPLHVGNFYPDKLRHHRSTMLKRQDLILYLANLHAKAVSSGMPLGMIQIPMRLTTLREWVHDYRVVLDRFFEVIQLGFNLGEGNHDLSLLIPKKITNGAEKASAAAASLKYIVPPRPNVETISKVYIQQQNSEKILERLAKSSRLDLQAPVEWLLSQSEVNFMFERSGRLKVRDTSVWPVLAVETWPAWLREDLFGPGIDIDAAYTQFLIQKLKTIYKDQESLLELMYPDILRSLYDKTNWRRELCTEVLGLQETDENIGTVKRICMSLANGSRISPAILTGGRAFSVTADIIVSAVDVDLLKLEKIGSRFQKISKQYAEARKAICSAELRSSATRKNQKRIFESYFEWERVARYNIWNACDRHGIMVHDGIDGIPEQYLLKIPEIINDIGIKIS